MQPDLEFFLEDALKCVNQTAPEIGRVVIEPDYNATPDDKDAGHLASELVQCLREASVNPVSLSSRHGQDIEIPGQYRLLQKYIRRITLHANALEGEWIEVAPPGNWI
jgi:hypothetical protein